MHVHPSCQLFQNSFSFAMDIAPRPDPKPKDPTSASEIGDAFGLITSSVDEWSSDADAEALFTKFAESSSESHDDATAAGGAAGGSALSSAAHNLQQISSTKDGLTQQEHRVRGKHGKLKKMSTKYRHQEESEREEALQVRPCSHFNESCPVVCSHT
jgi:hypothetical protein